MGWRQIVTCQRIAHIDDPGARKSGQCCLHQWIGLNTCLQRIIIRLLLLFERRRGICPCGRNRNNPTLARRLHQLVGQIARNIAGRIGQRLNFDMPDFKAHKAHAASSAVFMRISRCAPK